MTTKKNTKPSAKEGKKTQNADLSAFGDNTLLITELKNVLVHGKEQRPRYIAQYAEIGKRNMYASCDSYMRGELPLAILDPHTPMDVRLKYKTLFDVVGQYKHDKKELEAFLDLFLNLDSDVPKIS